MPTTIGVVSTNDSHIARLAELVNELSVVRGKVTLASGLESDFYVDMRRATLHHEAAPLIGHVMLDMLEEAGLGTDDIDAVGGLTMGADPVAAAMLHAAASRGLDLDAFVVRKAAKDHGMRRRIEGPDVAGRSVVVLEDTSTTGGSPLEAVEALREEEVTPRHVDANDVEVRVPAEVPNAIYTDAMWDEYTQRCIKCGRCNLVCPTCTCFTMQDAYYSDNGRVGERRRVMASCMIDGYTNVAGGGSYRKAAGDRMRFKVLHKVYDFRRRFGYDMCVGCGRCDSVCPEYISFSGCVNKLAGTVDALAAKEVADHA